MESQVEGVPPVYPSTPWTERIYSQAEVAAILGCSLKTIQAEERRVLAKLREAFCLDGTGYEWLMDRRERGAGIL